MAVEDSTSIFALITPSAVERFWKKVNRIDDADSCWPWIAASVSEGYGQFWLREGGLIGAHRVAWMLQNGRDVPNGLWVLHKCDNRRCCRGEHLFIGTHVDNMRDAVEKGSMRGRTPKRTRRFDAETAARLVVLHAAGMSYRRIAKLYGVNHRAIGNAITRSVGADLTVKL